MVVVEVRPTKRKAKKKQAAPNEDEAGPSTAVVEAGPSNTTPSTCPKRTVQKKRHTDYLFLDDYEISSGDECSDEEEECSEEEGEYSDVEEPDSGSDTEIDIE